jgi:hypothetical protein
MYDDHDCALRGGVVEAEACAERLLLVRAAAG